MTMLRLVLLIVLVDRALSGCPAVNTAINCSFETSEGCYGSYQWQDEHGLQWLPKSGAVVDANRLTSLIASPENMNYVTSVGSRGTYQKYMSMPGVDDPRIAGHRTDLISPSFIIGGQGCFYFLFHNSACGRIYQPSTSNFRVLLRPKSEEDGTYDPKKDILLRDYPCVNSTQWIYEKLPLNDFTGTFKLIFSARHHEVPSQVIAVDRVRFIDQSCSIRDDIDFVNGECDFEDADLCNYRTKINTKTSIQWKVVQRDMLLTSKLKYAPPRSTQKYDPRSGRNIQVISQTLVDVKTPGSQAPDGKFLLVWGQDSTTDIMESLTLKSPKFTIKETGCLSVIYYNGRYATENNDTDALTVQQTNNGGNKSKLLYTFPTSLSKTWLEALIPLHKGRYAVKFTARIFLPYGDNPYDVIGLDDIEIHQKSCDEVRCDDVICDVNKTACSGHGKCTGRGRKHYSCSCTLPYLGKTCNYNSNPPNQQGYRG